MSTPVRIFKKDQKLVIELPLNTPTGKIRVKRRNIESNYGSPIATRKKDFEFKNCDYLEWQISYATNNPPEESRVEGIVINNNQIGFELTKLLVCGLKLGILSQDDIEELKDFISSINSNNTLEENEQIYRIDNSQKIIGGFRKFTENVPIFIKENRNEGYFIEIILRHKQRAIGLQAMVYLCIYVEQLKYANGDPLINRPPLANEIGQLEIDSNNKTIILDTVKSFAIASQQHNRDISDILNKILENINQLSCGQ
ncbi:MAG: R.Pab1 family restriction endonuclease [Caldisphaera sp.]